MINDQGLSDDVASLCICGFVCLCQMFIALDLILHYYTHFTSIAAAVGVWIPSMSTMSTARTPAALVVLDPKVSPLHMSSDGW